MPRIVSFLIISYFFAIQPLRAQWEKLPNISIQFFDIAEMNGALFAAASGGLYRSDNDGQSWDKIYSSPASDRARVVKSYGNKLYILNYLQLMISSNAGKAWVKSQGQFAHYSFCVNEKGTVFCVADTANIKHRLKISKDDGQTWIGVTKNIPIDQTPVFNSRIFTDGDGFYYQQQLGAPIYYSADDGGSWEKVDVPTDAISVVFSDNKLVAIGNKQMYTSTDRGKLWVNKTLPETPYEIVIEGNLVFAQVDSGKIYKSENSGLDWMLLPPNNLLFWPYTNKAKLFVSSKGFYYGLSAFGLDYSTNGGMSWMHSSVANFPRGGVTNVQNVQQNLFATLGNSIVRSKDQGNTWQMCFPLTGDVHLSHSATLITSFLAPYIYLSSDSGTNWKIVPTNPLDTIYSSTVQGTNLYYSALSGVFKSDDQGKSWVKTSSKHLATEAFYKFKSNSRVLCGFSYPDNQIYLSHDEAESWSKLSLPVANIFDIENIFCFEDLLIIVCNRDLYVSKDDGKTWRSILNNLAGKSYVFATYNIAYKDKRIYLVGVGLPIHISNEDLTEWYKADHTGLIVESANAIEVLGDYVYLAQIEEGLFRQKLSQLIKVSTEGIERPEHAIFPNPTNGLLQVLNCENGMANIITGNGVVVKSSFIQGGILDISELPCGLYQIQIDSKDSTFTKLIAKF